MFFLFKLSKLQRANSLQKASKMRLSEILKIELLGIQKYYRDVSREMYSHRGGVLHAAKTYQLILATHSNNIHAYKARLEEIMDLTDKKES